MNLLIIGHSVEDHIGDKPATPGGIFFTAAAISLLSHPSDSLYLHTFTEAANFHLFAPAFHAFRSDFLVSISKIPRVHLTLHEDRERTERFENINTELPCDFPDSLKPDGILLNMITGYETTPEKLATLKEQYNCPVYLDTHSLSRGYAENRNREFRQIPKAELWVRSVDILQANEHEIMTYPFGTKEAEVADAILAMGTSAVIVTKGEQGVTCYQRGKVFDIPAPVVPAINKVGCGDVFGASFFIHYLRHGVLVDALHFGVKTATFVTTISNENFFSGFKNALIAKPY